MKRAGGHGFSRAARRHFSPASAAGAPAANQGKGLKLAPGKPYSQQAVNQDRNQILASYLEQGYLNATLRTTARQLPGQSHRIEVVYSIDEGPRVQTATVVTLGRSHSQQALLNKNTSELAAGKPLSESDMLKAGSQLYTLGVFDLAEVDPRRRVTTQTQEDVIIKVHESQRNVITYGFGFEVINRGGSVPSGTIAVPGLPPVGLSSLGRLSPFPGRKSRTESAAARFSEFHALQPANALATRSPRLWPDPAQQQT